MERLTSPKCAYCEGENNQFVLFNVSGEYSGIEFLNTNGKLDKNKVYLSDIPPFGFVGFEVKI